VAGATTGTRRTVSVAVTVELETIVAETPRRAVSEAVTVEVAVSDAAIPPELVLVSVAVTSEVAVIAAGETATRRVTEAVTGDVAVIEAERTARRTVMFAVTSEVALMVAGRTERRAVTVAVTGDVAVIEAGRIALRTLTSAVTGEVALIVAGLTWASFATDAVTEEVALIVAGVIAWVPAAVSCSEVRSRTSPTIATYAEFRRYAAARSSLSGSSPNLPRAKLHALQRSPRTRPVEWSWSMSKNSRQPSSVVAQIAQAPPCRRSFLSYSSGMIPKQRFKLPLRWLWRCFSGFSAFHL
jgi:hypothetical protein